MSANVLFPFALNCSQFHPVLFSKVAFECHLTSSPSICPSFCCLYSHSSVCDFLPCIFPHFPCSPLLFSILAVPVLGNVQLPTVLLPWDHQCAVHKDGEPGAEREGAALGYRGALAVSSGATSPCSLTHEPLPDRPPWSKAEDASVVQWLPSAQPGLREDLQIAAWL